MNRKTRWIVGTGLAVALVGGVTGMAVAAGGGDHETPITGEALGKASAAALVSTGGGRVSGTEVGDEEGYYEVEVTLPGGGLSGRWIRPGRPYRPCRPWCGGR